MATYFFPSCKATAQFKQASKNARAYVKERLGVEPIGCCRPNHTKLAANDTAIVVCNNCALIIDENTDANIEFLWEVIDRDPDFPFPDYGGERMTLQDCWIAFDRPAAHEAVRSLLRKMNVQVVELPENRESSKFCVPNARITMIPLRCSRTIKLSRSTNFCMTLNFGIASAYITRIRPMSTTTPSAITQLSETLRPSAITIPPSAMIGA